MKILIVSDSHGDVAALRKAVEREQPDRVFHLGDLCGDAHRLAESYPKLSVWTVAGNCDAWGGGSEEPEQISQTVEKVNFFLCHGHKHWVKMGTAVLFREGESAGADVICFGHTHNAVCKRQNGRLLVNPGSVGGVHAPATYAVAEVEDGEVSIELKSL